MSVNDDFIKKLERRGFKQNLSLIKLCRESYEGGDDYITKDNLFSHTRELPDEYADRLNRAYYLNYVAPIIDTYSFFLFKNSVIRDFKKAENKTFIDLFLSDCDKKGTTLDSFMKELSIDALTAGRSWLVIDVPLTEAKTKAEELILGKRPYVYSIPTENILDFSYDNEGGGLEWIKYIEFRSNKDTWDYSEEGKKVFVIWTKTSYTSFSEKGAVLQTVNHNLGFVPIIEVKFGKGSSIVKDIARVNRSLFNWCSLLDELLYRQTFSWLVVPGDSDNSLASKKIGTSWAWTFNPESKHVPQFISPDSSQANILENRCEKAIAEIYRQANLDWSNSQMANKSGIAKAYDFMNVNKALIALASTLEETEKKIFKIFNSYYETGEEVTIQTSISDSFTISYTKDFSFTAFSEKIGYLYQALTTEFSKTFRAKSAKEIVLSTFPSIPEEEKETIFEEIVEFFEKALEEEEEGIDEDDYLQNYINNQSTEEEVEDDENIQ